VFEVEAVILGGGFDTPPRSWNKQEETKQKHNSLLKGVCCMEFSAGGERYSTADASLKLIPFT
jgi:hypothetical protein